MTILEQDSSFLLVTSYDAVMNRSKVSIDNARIQYDSYTTEEFIVQVATLFRIGFQVLAQNGAKSRVIIGAVSNEDLVKKAIEEMRLPKGTFIVKITDKKSSEDYAIIDHNEVWIRTQKSNGSSMSICVMD